jgi:hypothetical protein
MEHLSYSMPCIRSNNRITKRFYMSCYNISTLSIHISRFAVSYGLHEGIIGCLNKSSAALADLADAISLIHISMEAIDVAADIKVDNVSLFKRPGVRDAVADALIYTCAAAAREVVVVQGTWVPVVLNDIVMNNFVNFFGCDTWSYGAVTSITSATSYLACLTHQFDFFCGMNWGCFISELLESLVWSTSLRVIRFLDMVWDLPLANK